MKFPLTGFLIRVTMTKVRQQLGEVNPVFVVYYSYGIELSSTDAEGGIDRHKPLLSVSHS